MARPSHRGDAIKHFILDSIPNFPNDVVFVTSQEFGISRQAVNRYIHQLLDQELITSKGNTRNRKYELRTLYENSFSYKLNGLQEHLVWQDIIAVLLENIPENVQDIWHYGCTEMINNAIDHSEGDYLTVFIEWNANETKIWLDDDGIGIFKKIMVACGLDDERHAILELAKGKLTTDPEHHTGEGIFFSSRMFDAYIIFSGGVDFSHYSRLDEDWIWEREQPITGTQVYMRLKNNSTRISKEIFEKFSSKDDDYGFTKTVVPVRLARQGHEKLISRSQAKRLMARVDRFKTVILDFSDVDSIGQAFADEIFRVFASQHPDIQVRAALANRDIRKMIKRARNNQTQVEFEFDQ